MQKKAQYTIILTIVSLLASVGVSSTFMLTKGTIKKKELAVRTEALYRVLPGLEGLPVEISPINNADADVGYSSKNKFMVAIDSNLEKILENNILSQN